MNTSFTAHIPSVSIAMAKARFVLLSLFIFVGFVISPPPIQAQTGCQEDYDILMAFFDSTNGSTWTDNTNWGTGCPCDNNWYGITCENGEITRIILQGNNLSGFLPASLSALSNLERIYLNGNFIAGSLPPEWGVLTNLTHLYLRFNQLTGNIPGEWGGMSSLIHLHLYENDLNGVVEEGLGSLSNLTQLRIENNQLTGPLPTDWNGLTSLGTLYINDNPIADTLPSTWGGMQNIREIRAYSCELNGSLPDSLGNLTLLEDLDLRGNLLSGSIPGTFGQLQNLQELHINGNSLTGVLPPELGALTNLTHLYLNYNQLSGSIPGEWGGMSSLLHLHLYENDLNGVIEEGLGSLSKLTQLRIENNQLTGSLPADWGGLTSLGRLYANDNLLSGCYPNNFSTFCSLPNVRMQNNPGLPDWDSFCSYSTGACATVADSCGINGTALLALYNSTNGSTWTDNTNWGTGCPCTDDWFGVNCSQGKIVSINLANNNLSGTLAPELGQLSSLVTLSLQGNQIGGELPPEWGGMTSLQTLYLNTNHLTGDLPGEWGGMDQLVTLYLHVNSLNGVVEEGLGGMVSLKNLVLANNQLSGNLPSDWNSLTQLEQLNIQNNSFSDSIPENWGDFQNLKIVLGRNSGLMGAIPSSLGNVSTLEQLRFEDNDLTGEIPSSLGNLNNLTHLYLNGNELSGNLPPSLGQSTNLIHVELQGNSFSGELPREWGALSNLQILYLNSNNLTGGIPGEWGGMSQLTTLHLQVNALDGIIEEGLGGMTSLKSLTLSTNNLTGNLPSDWNTLTQLERLNIEGNSFSDSIPENWGEMQNLEIVLAGGCGLMGSIPSSLGNISSLEQLRFQNNNLTGEIPSSLGNLDNLTHLYLSGNDLSGNLPPSMGQMTNLTYLELQGNSFSGELPREWGTLSNLQTLYLHANNLSGGIPGEWGGMSQLRTLYLHQNSLDGIIEEGFGNPGQLLNLYLQYNQLTGCYPQSFSSICSVPSVNLDANPGLPDFNAFCADGSNTCPPEGSLQTYDSVQGAISIYHQDGWSTAPDTFSTVGAYRKGPINCGGVFDPNRWFKFTAQSPYIELELLGNINVSNRIGLYQQLGDSLASRACLSAGNSPGTLIYDNLEPEAVYFVSISSGQGAANQFNFGLSVSTQYTYNHVEGAIEIQHLHNWSTAPDTFSTVGAYRKGPINCGGVFDPNRWFKFTAQSPYIELELLGNINVSNRIGLYQQLGDSLASRACLSAGNSPGTLIYDNLEPEAVYFVSISSGQGAANQFNFGLSVSTQYTYNHVEGAIEIQHLHNWSTAPDTFSTVGAYRKGPINCGGVFDPNRWFKFTAQSPYIELELLGNINVSNRIGLYQQLGDSLASRACLSTGNSPGTLIYDNLEPEAVYFVSISSGQGAANQFDFGLSVSTQYTYNHVEGAIEIQHLHNWSTAPDTFSTVGAYRKGPINCGGVFDPNRWFTFTAQSAYIELSLIGDISVTNRIGIWEQFGDSLAYRSCASGTTSPATLTYGLLNPGGNYVVAVTSTQGAENQFDFGLSISLGGSSNPLDTLNAIVIPHQDGWISDSTAYTTPATHSGPTECINGRNQWFTFSATSNYIGINLLNDWNKYHGMSLWHQVGDSMELINCMVTWAEGLSLHQNELIVGDTYFLSVDSYVYNLNFGLEIDLTYTYDHIEGAIEIPHQDGWSSDTTEYSTHGARHTGPDDCLSGPNRWFTFTADSEYIGVKLLNDKNLYHGMSLWHQVGDSLELVNCMTSWVKDLALHQDGLTVGDTYYISVDSYLYHSGYYFDFGLEIDLDYTYDHIEGAIVIPHQDGWASDSNEYNTLGARFTGPSECGTGPNRWFTFTAQADNIELQLVDDKSTYHHLSIWQLEGDSLNLVACEAAAITGLSVASDQLIEGETYYVSVNGHLYHSGYYFDFGIQISVQSQQCSENHNALMALYNATDGPNWNNKTNWGEGCPCENNWYGVGCDSLGRVEGLFLPLNNLNGPIPPEIGDLTALKEIRLNSNPNIDNTLPPEFGDMESLEEAWLQAIGLTSLPPEIEKLQNLSRLYLFNNNLSSLPQEIVNLNGLIHLDIGRNNFSVLPPHIADIPNLEYLLFYENSISALPEEIFTMPNLIWINGKENNIDTLPANVGYLSSLETFIINSNQIEFLPKSMSALPNLNTLEVHNNNIACLDEELSSLCTLDSVNFSGNPIDFQAFCTNGEYICTACTPENLALGKSSTQSDTHGNGSASLAVDGNLIGSTNWGGNADLQHTPNQAQPWWEVDLQTTVDIENVRIYNRTSCCQDRLSKVHIFTSHSPMDPNATVQGLLGNENVFQIAYQDAAIGASADFPTDLSGRYVRIQLDKTTSLHMAEVEVYGCETAQDSFPPAIPTGLVAYNVQGNTLNLDWNKPADIGSGIGGYYLYQDGAIVDTVDSDSAFIQGLSKNTSYSFAVEAFDLAGNRSGVSTAINVMTLNTQCENFALGKPAEQSSTYGNGVASLANDGNTTGTTNWGGSADLQHTNTEAEPWWQVDLESGIIMDSLVIYNRTGSNLNRLSDFHVFISQQSFAGGASLSELLNDASIYHMSYNGSAEQVYTFFPNTFGRYVRIQLEANTNEPLHMAEVEVYGCEVAGDTLAPSVPQNLAVSNEMGTSLTLSWEASSDEGLSGVAGYYIYLDGSLIDSTTDLSYELDSLEAGNTYLLHVAAYDYVGNVSTLGGPIPGTTTNSNCGNLALNKSAEMSSTYGNSLAGLAINGMLTGTSPWTPNLQHTQSEAQAWWQVDLGLSADLDSVVIYNRSDGNQGRLQNFYILVSTQPFSSQASLQDLLDDPSIGQSFYGSPGLAKYSIPVSQSGQYVRIQLSTGTNTPLHMAEVQVYGCESLELPAPEGKSLQELVNCIPASNSHNFLPDRFEDQNKNYVKSVIFRQDQSTTPGTQKDWESITYFDGLGRPIQSIEYQASPNGLDLVSPIEYDSYGRQPKAYLPFAHEDPNLPGNFKNDWEGDQTAFYLNLNSISGDRSNPIALTQFEASPLNRPIEQGAPGSAWQPQPNTPGLQVANTEHTVVTAYKSNTSGVPGFAPESLEGTDITAISDYYPANSLTVVQVIDENGALTETATDLQGRTIYKSVQVDGSVAADPLTSNNFATTYFVYDIFGNVRFVIQPEGWKDARTAGITATIKEDFCFQYRYDARQRVKAKKVPGADWVYLVYDKLDRVVATQDGNLKAKGQWLVTKYDKLGRPVMTGIHTSTDTQSALQDAVDQNTSQFEDFDGTAYTNSLAPQISAGEFHSITYYDTYSFKDGLPEYNFQEESSLGFLGTSTGVAVPYDTAASNRGRVTGVMVFVLEPKVAEQANISITDTALLTVTYYDKYGREIQTIADNHLGGKEFVANRYNFAGELLESVQIHQWGDAEKEQRIHKAFVYDHRARLTEVLQQINEDAAVVLASHHYDELGQLVEKNLGGLDCEAELQSVDYQYNIRGWMTDINQVSAGNGAAGPDGDLFGMKLNYNVDPTDPFNGNISGISWQHAIGDASQDILRGYDFTYDKMNRLKMASFTGGLSGEDYSIPSNIVYDLNGNIKNLQRNGKRGENSYGSIDDLVYTYNGNRLNTLTDNSGFTQVLEDIDHFTTQNNGGDYQYDASGNITVDPHKGISFTYNHLNKPTLADFGPDKKIHWVYSADGTKLKEYYISPGDSSATHDYVSGFFYKSEQLLHIAHEEGRALKLGDYFRYEFNLTDHLGNVRVSFSDTDYNGAIEVAEGEVLQVDQYYPFGMRLGGLSYQSGTENRFRYNGKEFHQELNLGLYDYGARMYDPSIGRFSGIDPIAEDFNWVTPYNYAENEPVAHIDLWGLQKAGMQIGLVNAREHIRKTGGDLEAFDSAVEKNAAISRKVAFTIFGAIGGGAAIAKFGLRAVASFLFNEAKDEALSRATGGLSDVADVSKQAKNLGKEVLSKGERLKIFIKNLTEADSPSNPDEALDLINKTMDEVEDTYSGVKKNPNAASMPNRDDGRMYGILDDTFVKRHEDGSLTARTKGNKIEVGSDGSIKILSKDGEKTFLDKPGKQE